MMLKTLDEIKAMDGHPDVSYGDVMSELAQLYELLNIRGDSIEDVHAWARHADGVICKILIKAEIAPK